MEKTKQAIKTLESAIRYHKECYYNQTPEISDSEYDKLEEELRQLDPINPVLNKVGTPVHPTLSTKHQIWMPSIQKIQNDIPAVQKWIGDKSVVFSFKLDGHSMSLVYKSGKFVQALTRGDGEFGEDRTEFFNYIKIPDYIEQLQGFDVVIWGEVVITKENFELLKEEMISLGLDPVKSIRNSVGVLNGKSNKQLAKYFDFVAHNMFPTDDARFTMKHSEKFDFLRSSYGFEIPYCNFSIYPMDFNNFVEYYKTADYPYLTDGIVITENKDVYDLNDKTSHHYRWNICWKNSTDTAITKVKNIDIAVKRTGKISFVANLEHVFLSGAELSRATCHNARFVIDNNIGVGSTVEICRSNEVIPKILKNVSDDCITEFEDVELAYSIPITCPSCNSILEWSDSKIDLFCRNHENCPEQIISKLVHYASVMQMDNISESTVRLFVEHGLIKTFYDFYKITTNDLLRLPRIKEAKAQVIMTSIDNSIRNWSDERFVVALGIPNIGKDVAKKLIKLGIDSIRNEGGSRLDGVDGIGETIYRSILSNINYICDSLETIKTQLEGLITEEPKEATKEPIQGLKLSGKTFLLSGKLSVQKKVLEALIIENGGVMQSTVNKDLSYLISNETGTAKCQKANQLGKTILTESELMEMIK